jgi:hypothetical protein
MNAVGISHKSLFTLVKVKYLRFNTQSVIVHSIHVLYTVL